MNAAELQATLDRIAESRTTIMIAHRLHTLRHCDLQLVLRQGRILVQAPDWEPDDLSQELVHG